MSAFAVRRPSLLGSTRPSVVELEAVIWRQRFEGYFNEIRTLGLDEFGDDFAEHINSGDSDYVMRCIREKKIAGTSCTVVLIGKCTWARRYVDWEIAVLTWVLLLRGSDHLGTRRRPVGLTPGGQPARPCIRYPGRRGRRCQLNPRRHRRSYLGFEPNLWNRHTARDMRCNTPPRRRTHDGIRAI
jgi:hypothetical protein